MPIITISRGSYSKGKEVAEKVARKLNYECVSRDIILEASKEFHVPEIKLMRALHDAPSVLDRFLNGKKKYVAYVQSALLEHLKKDNVVYHGLAGHFFVKGVSHVIKVRIIADLANRIKQEIDRENISEKEARYILKKDDNERRKWSRHLYGIDTRDSSLYDIVIHIHKITIDDAADFIAHVAGLKYFQAIPESQAMIEDLALAARVKGVLINIDTDIEISAKNGFVYVKTEAPLVAEQKTRQRIQKAIKTIPGVKKCNINVLPYGVS